VSEQQKDYHNWTTWIGPTVYFTWFVRNRSTQTNDITDITAMWKPSHRILWANGVSERGGVVWRRHYTRSNSRVHIVGGDFISNIDASSERADKLTTTGPLQYRRMDRVHSWSSKCFDVRLQTWPAVVDTPRAVISHRSTEYAACSVLRAGFIPFVFVQRRRVQIAYHWLQRQRHIIGTRIHDVARRHADVNATTMTPHQLQ